MSPTKRAELLTLFEEFTLRYLRTPVGEDHLRRADRAIEEGRRNYARVLEAERRGEEITDLVLNTLIPHKESDYNRARGAWCHYAPVVNKDLRYYFEKSGWPYTNEWPEAARSILTFVTSAIDNPDELENACRHFLSRPYSRGFQSGRLSPILAAVRPDRFILINNKSRETLNYLTDRKLGQSLADYPECNAAVWSILLETGDELTRSAGPVDARPALLFDIFTHWLVAERKFFEKKREPREKKRADISSILTRFFPDESDRIAAASALAETIVFAHALNPNNWSLTYRKDQDLIRLNVGPIEAMRLSQDSVAFLVDAEMVPTSVAEENAPYVTDATNDYASLPGAKSWIRVAPGEVAEASERFGDAQRSFLTAASAKRPRTTTWATHNDPHIVANLRTILGRELPDPDYVREGRDEMAGVARIGNALFTETSFELLRRLHEAPVKETYLTEKRLFRTELEEPLERLLSAVAARLPAAMRAQLETEKKTTGRILKNDYGKGGAWDYYWGAFYPTAGKRTEDAQLYVWMNGDRLEYGFYIGEYGSAQRARFIETCRRHEAEVRDLLHETMRRRPYRYGHRDDFIGSTAEERTERVAQSFDAWLSAPDSYGIHIAVVRPKGDVINDSLDDLADEIATTFIDLFPFVHLAMLDNPLDAIRHWLTDGSGQGTGSPIHPPYSLDQLSNDTGLGMDRLTRWVAAVHRKKQAIIYGPPGTGKTYVAQHLARHLVGGGDGVIEKVQFHPAYSYEEFIQGIRPQRTERGELDYRMMRGRFLSFCDMAASRAGLSVLIIDEINRAHLARVFGELMFLLEYRDEEMSLAGGGTLKVPENVRIIGTMNTADRSVALVDHALRRRFAFLELRPEYDVLANYHRKRSTGFQTEGLITLLKKLNDAIDDPHYEIGISYFLRDDIAGSIADIWRMEIEPYLQEFFFDQPEKAKAFAWESAGKQIA